MIEILDISYFSAGWRWYGRKPVLPHGRELWEFQVILEGECRVQLMNRRWLRAGEGSFWLFRPGFVHGWSGRDPDTKCRMAVFHVSDVPGSVKQVMGERNFVESCISTQGKGELEQWKKRMPGILEMPVPLRALRSTAVVMELGCWFLENQQGELREEETGAARLLRQSLSWMSSHLHEGCGVEELAAAMRRSPQHLRRIFLQESGQQPRHHFTGLRVARAKELLRQDDYTLEVISEAVGYSCAAALSRAFKKETGMTARAYREMNA